MRIAILSKKGSAVAQPSIIEIIGLANLGYRSLVCVQSIDETIDPTSWLQIKAAANAWRMEAIQLKIAGVFLGKEEIEAIRRALEKLPGPVAAFCRTDVRRAILNAFPSDGDLQCKQGTSVAIADDHGLELLQLY